MGEACIESEKGRGIRSPRRCFYASASVPGNRPFYPEFLTGMFPWADMVSGFGERMSESMNLPLRFSPFTGQGAMVL
jgi:hypothetical protein